MLADALAAFDWLQAKGFPIVLWGRSLGSGPATYVASQREADALLLETPFISAVAVAADRYGFLPVGLLMHDQYPVDQWIKDVAEPVFVAHGTADKTIGVSHGEGSTSWRRTRRILDRGGRRARRPVGARASGSRAEGRSSTRSRRRRRAVAELENENAGPVGPAFRIQLMRSRSSTSVRPREGDRVVEAGLALDRPGLQREALARAADQPVAAEADADGRFGRAADIGAGERAACRTWSMEPENTSHSIWVAAGDADVDAELVDGAVVVLGLVALAVELQVMSLDEPMMKPMPASTSQVSTPTWTWASACAAPAVERAQGRRAPRARSFFMLVFPQWLTRLVSIRVCRSLAVAANGQGLVRLRRNRRTWRILAVAAKTPPL